MYKLTFKKRVWVVKQISNGEPVNRPQTNGKAERFFLTYKTEYIQETFTNLKDFIKYSNLERPHMSLYYKTPHEIWKDLTQM